MKIILSVALTLVGTWAGGCFATASATGVVTKEGAALRDALVREASRPVKPAWRPMLLYLAGVARAERLSASGPL